MATESKASESKESGVNIKVVVRCRPLSSAERDEGTPSVVHVAPGKNELAVRGSLKRPKSYAFDKVYGQYSTQEQLFGESVVPIIQEVLQGFNCTVFAYGQTGTGKTYTMEGEMGTSLNAGIIPRSINMIFDHLKSNASEYSVRLSFLELYNEQLADLLYMADDDLTTLKRSGGRAPGAGSDTPAARDDHRLRIVDDSRKGTVVNGLEEVLVHNAEEAFDHVMKAVKRRHVAETILNKASSRSHSIFTVTVHTKETTPEGEDLLKVGKLNLVDLAGSECIGRSGAKNDRAREAGNINQSLLTLGRVITALVDHLPHVPYRDSKLTRLLQDSLGGRTKTCIIATLSPSVLCVDETVSTLDYANRAKNIKNRPVLNQKMTKRALIKEYSQEIERLKEELKCARDKHGVYLPTERYEQMQLQLASQGGSIAELEALMKTHQEARAALEAENAAVTTAFREATADVDLLHDKIGRKAAVEAANVEEASGYAAETTARLGGLNGTVAAFQTAQQAELDRMVASIDGLVAHRAGETKTLTTCIGSITDAVAGFVAGTQAAATAFTAAGDEETATLQAKVADFQASFGGLMQSSGATIKRELSQMSALIAKQQQQLEAWAGAARAFTATFHDDAAAFAQRHTAAVTAATTAVHDSVASVEAQLAAARRQLDAVAAQRRERVAANREELLAFVTAIADKQLAAVDADASVATKAVEAVEATLPVATTAMDSAVAGAADTVTEFVAASTATVAAHGAAADGHKAAVADALLEGETLRGSVSTCIDASLAKASTDVSAVMTDLLAAMDAGSSRMATFTSKLGADVEAAKGAVDADADKVAAAVAAGETAFAAACSAVTSQAAEGSGLVAGFVAAHSEWVEGERMAVDNFARDRLRVDVSTGSTPVKKAYLVTEAPVSGGGDSPRTATPADVEVEA